MNVMKEKYYQMNVLNIILILILVLNVKLDISLVLMDLNVFLIHKVFKVVKHIYLKMFVLNVFQDII